MMRVGPSVTRIQVPWQGTECSLFRPVEKLTHVCSRPDPFPCLFSPRDQIAEELIIADGLAR